MIPPSYHAPKIASVDMGKNQPICGNESHSKATNNGFSRNSMGGFYAHWKITRWFLFVKKLERIAN